MNPDQEVKLTVRQIRDAAKHCSTARGVMKKMFPHVFEADDLYYFEEGGVLSEDHTADMPFYIGTVDAKDKHKNKILIVDPDWGVSVYPKYFQGRAGITFTRRQEPLEE